MKNTYSCLLYLLTLLFVLLIGNGCHKNPDDPNPIKKKYVWAVGGTDSTNYGLILFSADGGITWTRQGEGSDALKGASFNDVWAIDENTVWAIGYSNLIVKTHDGGKTWTKIDPPVQQAQTDLNAISIVGKNKIWISTSNGLVYNSADGGMNWTLIQSAILSGKFLQGIHAIEDDLVYVTGGYPESSHGFLARTLDGGHIWDSIPVSEGLSKHPCIGIAASDKNNVVVYGGASYYMYSHDGGGSWESDSIPNTGGGGTGGSDINCLKMVDQQTWWGAFDLDAIYKTENAGNAWESQGPAPAPGNMWLLGIDHYGNDTCVIVGSSENSNTGKIIHTTDGGANWKLAEQTDGWMLKVSFIK